MPKSVLPSRPFRRLLATKFSMATLVENIAKKKLRIKKYISFSHGGSFGHVDMQSLTGYNFFLFSFAAKMFELLGACNTPLER